MYQTLIVYHSFFRWIVLASLILSIYKSVRGYILQPSYKKIDNAIRHWTATIAHIQLVLGIILYTQSPIIKYFWQHIKEASHNIDTLFFGIIHIVLMSSAVIIITIGSALAKRNANDKQKYKTQLIWYSIALLIICIAIPWPFSPFAHRPYIR